MQYTLQYHKYRDDKINIQTKNVYIKVYLPINISKGQML